MSKAPLQEEVEEIAETVEAIESIEEVDPISLIEGLEVDLKIAVASLRKIVRMNPALFSGGPTNKYFGRKHEQAFEVARKCALEALQRLENHPDDDS